MEKIKTFCKRKNIEISVKRYGTEAMGAMAKGLFASLLIGTVFQTLGEQTNSKLLVLVGEYAKRVSGSAMAVAIGTALHAPPLVLYSLAAVGEAANTLGGAGGPFCVLIVTITAAEIGKAVSGETKADMLITPFVTVLCGVTAAYLFAPSVGAFAAGAGNFLTRATEKNPLFTGIMISVVTGIALTLPISSAAICASVGIKGLAAGAALAGTSAHMTGFAILSFRENGWGGFFAQSLGTSMLQMGNIIKNPKVFLPPILTSAITGALSVCAFKLEMNGPSAAAGMGTCGLAGPLGVYNGWLSDIEKGIKAQITSVDIWGLFLICFLLPLVLTWGFGALFRKMGWIKEGDLKI